MTERTPLIIGDSLTVSCWDLLEQAAAQARRTWTIDAENGRSLQRAPIILVHRAEPSAIVIALGTNDVARAAPQLDALVDDTIAACAADVPLWWVDVHVAGGRGAVVNEALGRAVARHPRVTLLRWSEVAAQHPEAIADDGVHLTTDGCLRFTRLIATALLTPGR